MHSLETIKKLNGEYPEDGPAPCEVLVLPYDTLAAILAYETEGLDEEEGIELFQHLVDTGLAWELQGSYGRQAIRLIEAGVISDRPRG